MENNSILREVAIIALMSASVAFTASAADYNWTGLGDGHSWSDADNWTNAAGVVGAPAVAENVKHSYHFPVDDTGLVVTQDMKALSSSRHSPSSAQAPRP